MNNSCSRRSSLSSSYVSFHLQLLPHFIFRPRVHRSTINSQQNSPESRKRRERIAYDCLNIIFLSTCDWTSFFSTHTFQPHDGAAVSRSCVCGEEKLKIPLASKLHESCRRGEKNLWTFSGTRITLYSCRAHFHFIFSENNKTEKLNVMIMAFYESEKKCRLVWRTLRKAWMMGGEWSDAIIVLISLRWKYFGIFTPSSHDRGWCRTRKTFSRTFSNFHRIHKIHIHKI